MLLIALPTVVYGGTTLLTLLVGDPGFAENALRRDLWRAGHAHAGILLPAAFFLSVLAPDATEPDATEPNALINLAYLGAVSLAVGLLVLGIGLVRRLPTDPT